MPRNLRAALKGMLKRSHSNSGSSVSADLQPKTPESQHAPLTATSSRQSSLFTPFPKSPSKFSVQESIREEQDDEFHDAAEVNPRPADSTTRPAAAAATATAAAAATPTAATPADRPVDADADADNDDAHRDSQSRHAPSVKFDQPILTLQSATPEAAKSIQFVDRLRPQSSHSHTQPRSSSPLSLPPQSSPSLPSLLSARPTRPSEQTIRRQSLVTGANASAVHALLSPTAASTVPLPPSTPPVAAEAPDYFANAILPHTSNIASMLTRKVWVRRPGASPTMVTVREDDLVDDVRDAVMRKYGNSLGRSYDSPDLVMRIVSRSDNNNQRATERMLGPDEDICRTLDQHYPGGQTVDEALLIETPPRRTPRPSPRIYHGASYAALDDFRPAETGNDYFPPMPAVQLPANAAQQPAPQTLHPEQPRSIAVLNTGQIPVLPSPGSARRHREPRPKFNRQHTSSPTIMTHNPPPASVPLNASNLAVSQHLPPIRQGRPRVGSSASEQQPHIAPSAPPLPTPPAPEAPPTAQNGSSPPTPASQSQNNTLRPARPRRQRKLTPTEGTATIKSPSNGAKTSLPPSLLDGSVPPINVLIVEDNIINLKLLEAFMKRLKVRWSTAMNGQIAVNKWRAGGFHLVLMDIQLPIMSGLEATKEIRRLERVNGIGVFSTASPTLYSAKGENGEEPEEANKEKEDDRLVLDGGLFKSPVIIVALTASSLQSDRHEALAAGCNDFLTKPVNFVWLERKVKEWGCMQALIDFDGWRKWKDFDADKAAKEKKAKRISRASADGAPRSPRPAAAPEAPAQSNGDAPSTNE